MTGGRIIVVSAPSGSGKGTVIGKLLASYPGITPSISYTSRLPRLGETEGVHYYFVTKECFQDMIAAGEFVEWDQYQGDYYGTSSAKIHHILDSGGDIIFDITIKGAYSIKERFPQAALVFLLPPSFAELERRLRNRGTETEAKIAGRLKEARREITELKNFDYYIINKDAGEAANRLYSILEAEKSRAGAVECDAIIKRVTQNIQEDLF